MLRLAKDLTGYKLGATDGEIGKVQDFYFDDQSWVVRYLVADTGGWLNGRQVLISPYGLEPANENSRLIPVDLTRQQIENSPSLEADKPVSRQYEMQYYPYYGWPAYWGGAGEWGSSDYPMRREVEASAGVSSNVPEPSLPAKADDPHLRSADAISGYAIYAEDGEIGHVKDFVVDDETWTIRYLIVDTQNWWPGKKVLISTTWIERISWAESKVVVHMTRESIKQSPEYTEEQLINRDYETHLYQHYQRPGYWAGKPGRKPL